MVTLPHIPTPSATWRTLALTILVLIAAAMAWSSAPQAAAQSAPGQVASVTVTRANATLTAMWNAPAGATKYHITYSSDNKKSWSAAAGPNDNHAATTIDITGIDVSKSYVVGVRAGNAHGWGQWRNSASNSPDPPPGKPGTITVRRADGTLTASWDAVNGADKYHVTYSSDNRKSWSLAAHAHTTTGITFNVNNALTYIVGVRAGKTVGNATLWSGWRNSSSSGSVGPPAAPAEVSTNRVCDSKFSFSWTPVAGATGYDLVSSPNNRKSWQRLATNTGVTGGVFTSWQKDKTYYIAVRARNANGMSGWTNSAAAPAPACKAGNPKAVTATTHGTAGGSITTTWDAGHRASAYNLNYQVGSNWTRIASNISATTHTNTVTGTDAVQFAVQSIGNGTTSEWSHANIGWLTASNPTATGATLALAGHSGSWHVKKTSPSPAGTCSSAISGATHTLSTLTGSTTYTVTAYSDAVCANAIGSATFTTTQSSALPSAPAAPTLTTGNARLTVDWTAAAHNGALITDYDFRYRTVGTSTWSGAYIQGASYSPGSLGNWKQSNGSAGMALDLGNVSLSGLTVTKVSTGGISNVYKISEAVGGFRLKLNAKNAWNYTLTYQARYAATAPSTSNMNTHGTLLWEQSAGSGSSFTKDASTLALPANTHFWVTTTADGRTDIVTPTIQADAATVPSPLRGTVTGLTNGTNYDVQVRAVNANGLGPWSPSGTLKAGLPARPAAPALVSGNSRMTVNWVAANGNGSTITDYDIRYSSNGGSTWTTLEMNAAANTARSYTIMSLNNDTAYVVRLRATNTHGDSVWSPSSASVEAGTPDPPTAPALTPGSGQVTATWTAPANNGSAITDYDLRYCSTACSTASNWTFVENGTSAGTTATIPNLTDGTPYQVEVRATNGRGDSGWSPATTLATLTASQVTGVTATLTFAKGSHSGSWYLKKTAPTPAGTCSSTIAVTTTTQNLTNLTRNTAYTYFAYSDSACATAIARIAFSTLPSTLTASASNTSPTLTIAHHTGSWYVKETSPSTTGTCSSAISGTTHNLSGLTDGVPYVYHAYSDSACATPIARVAFTTTLYPPTGVSHSSNCSPFTCGTTVNWSRNSNTTGSVGYEVQFTDYDNSSWTHWHTEQPTTDSSLSDYGSSSHNFNARVRAFRTTSGVTVYSAWVE